MIDTSSEFRPDHILRLSDDFFMQLASHMVVRVSQASLLCMSRDGVSIPSKSVLELIAELDARGWVRKNTWTAKRSLQPFFKGGQKVWYGREHSVPFKDYLVSLLCADESGLKVFHLQCKSYYQCLKMLSQQSDSDSTHLLAHQPAQYYKTIMRRHDKRHRIGQGPADIHDGDDQREAERHRGDIMDLDEIAQAQIQDARSAGLDDQTKFRKQTTKAKASNTLSSKRARNDGDVGDVSRGQVHLHGSI